MYWGSLTMASPCDRDFSTVASPLPLISTPKEVFHCTQTSWVQENKRRPLPLPLSQTLRTTVRHACTYRNVVLMCEHVHTYTTSSNSNKPRSATYIYPLAIGRHTRPYIQPTTQQRHDRSRVGTTHNPDDAF
jgi:hypothetical protein